MQNNLQCSIVVPIYCSELKEEEIISLSTIRKHLSGYGICFVAPKSLDISRVILEGETVERFDDSFFLGVNEYSHLLETVAFYDRFKNSKYILICQLDCLIFSNNLDHWLSKNYDYIGAPWFKNLLNDSSGGLWRVGNGGLSLRKVESHLKVLRQKVVKNSIYPRFGNRYWKENYAWIRLGSYKIITFLYEIFSTKEFTNVEEELLQYHHNEDNFWSIEASKFDYKFRVPSAEKALSFAFEAVPSWCYTKNKNRIPFGCHAWARYDRDFWERFI